MGKDNLLILNRVSSEFLVLSVRPRFADAIVDGRKTIEVRRQRPNVRPGTLGFVYSSLPEQAVVGSFRIDKIFSGSPEEIWLMAHHRARISRKDFDSYFAGVEIAHAIVVSCGQRLPRPIKLSDLRAIWPGCKPPRSFGYLVAVDSYARRMMSIFSERLVSDVSATGEAYGNHVSGRGLQDHRGSFLLKREGVRTLVSLLANQEQ